MSIDQLRPAAEAAWAALRDHADPVLFGAGAVATVLGLALIWRFLRTGHAHTRVGHLAVALATAFTAEGMWEVARGKLELQVLVSSALFATFQIVMLSQGLLAKYKLSQDPSADVRRHMAFVWALAIGEGIIVATAGDSLTEVLLRLFAPVVAATIWWMGLTADRPPTAVTSWIWTPRRIGIHLGLIQPGEQDLVAVDRDRRIHRLTVTAHRLHHGRAWLAGWRRGRLRRLALQADDAMVDEARRRVERVHRIEALTRPATATEVEVAGERVAAELAAQMREARQRLTSGAARWALIDRPEVGLGDRVVAASESTTRPAIPPAAVAVEPPATPTTEPATTATVAAAKPATKPTAKSAKSGSPADRVAAAYDALVVRLGREPSGRELADEAVVSKSYANAWKRNRGQSD